MSHPSDNADTEGKQRAQEPPIGEPEQVEHAAAERAKDAPEESAEKGLPYETPRPTSVPE